MALQAYILGDGQHAKMIAGLVEGRCLGPNDMIMDKSALYYVGVGDPGLRAKLWADDLQFPRIILGHVLGMVGNGTHVMPGAVVMPNAVIDENVLINTGATIDHDCFVGAHSHIAPGAVLCGSVRVGKRVMIGAGAIILQGVEIDDDEFVPAGSLVVRRGDIRRPQRVVPSDGVS